MTLSGGRAHGGETGKRGAHANSEPCASPLGVHLNTGGSGMLEFGVQTNATSRPEGAGMDARDWGDAPNLTSQ